MNYNKYTVLFSLLVLTAIQSCNRAQKNEGIVADENDEILAPLKAEFNNQRGFLNPGSLSIIDSTLILIEDEIPVEFITFYSLSDNAIIQSFGKRGRGPGEFSDIIRYPVSVIGSDVPNLNIFDFVSKRLKKFNFMKLKVDPQIALTSEYILPPELLLAQSAVYLDNDKVIAMGGIKDGLLAFVDIKTDTLKYLAPFLLEKDKYSVRTLSQLYFGEFIINNINNSIAVAPLYIPEILITDFDGNVIRKIRSMDYNIDEIAQVAADDRTIQYHDIKGTEEYIYALYVGKTYEELGKAMASMETAQGDAVFESVSEVHVYDWEGKFIKKLVLDGGYYPRIAIDIINDRIYSINNFSQNLDIVYFEPDFDLK